MLIKLKLSKLYGKDKATIEELLSNRAGLNILPYEIAINDEVDWGSLRNKIPQDVYEKACLIYQNFSYHIGREKPLPKVKGKLPDFEVRRVFEVLRSIEE